MTADRAPDDSAAPDRATDDSGASDAALASHPVRLKDPRAMRALAHPARLAVIEELFAGRELTATECGEIAGLSPSAMSYHLRALERAGIVARAPSTGDGRERPWRAAGTSLHVETDAMPAGASAAAALSATVTDRVHGQFAAWMAHRAEEDPAWRDAAGVSSGLLWLTLEELKHISQVLEPLVLSWRNRPDDARPPGARRVRFALYAFPVDDPPGGPPDSAGG